MSFTLSADRRYVCWAARGDSENLNGVRTLRVQGSRPFRFLGCAYSMENGVFSRTTGAVGLNPSICVLPTTGEGRATFRTALAAALTADLLSATSSGDEGNA